MNPIWKKVKEYAKTIAVFLAGVIGPPLLRIFTGEDPFPQNKQEWINWIGAIAVSTVAAWLAKNKITQKQLDQDPDVAGGVVISEAKEKAAKSGYPTSNGADWPSN